jgi:DNA repair protein RadC
VVKHKPHHLIEVRFMQQTELEEKYLREIEITNSKIVYREMRDIKNWDKEVFVAFYLDTQNKIISREILSIGTLNYSVIHPREVFRTAIIRNANSVIIAHNHPSGNLEPSDEDIKITKQLKEAGQIIGIKLLDHVIVTVKGYYSFNDKQTTRGD